jgi:phage gp36-like protein
MPAYCTPADLESRFGLAELFQLAPGPGGVPDAVRVQRACEDAGDLVDGYLRPRHTLPLSTVPRVLVQLSAAIARYELHHGGDRQPTDQVTKARDNAIRFLQDVANGKADLGLGPDATEPAEDAGGVIVQRGEAAGLTVEDRGEYRGFGRW